MGKVLNYKKRPDVEISFEEHYDEGYVNLRIDNDYFEISSSNLAAFMRQNYLAVHLANAKASAMDIKVIKFLYTRIVGLLAIIDQKRPEPRQLFRNEN